MKGFLQNGDSEIAKSPHSLIKDDHVLNSHIGILQQPSSKPYILLSKHLRKSSDIIDYSEIAKIIPFRHQRYPCTKQPFWNFSTNIFFQTIYSFEKKIDGRLPTIWRLRNSLNHPIHISKMVMHYTAILEFFNQHLPNHIFSCSETRWKASNNMKTQK